MPRRRDAIPILVLGAGGNSLGVLDAIAAINALDPERPRYRVEGILDDTPAKRGRAFLGAKVVGAIHEAAKFKGCRFVNGIAGQETFRKIPDIVERTGVGTKAFETVIHPRAVVAPSARIGRGSVILAGSVVCPQAVIGDHVLVLQNASINHDCRIGEFATVSAGVTLLGFVAIGRNAFVGGGATVAPLCKVGDRALVGAGAVVVRDVRAGSVVAGNPARELASSRHNLRN